MIDYDLVIKNGKIIDGTGSPSYFADVAVKDGKIVKIAKNIKGGAEIIDAAGLCVTPGFIDSHSHSDGNLLKYPEQREKVEQGITTCIAGQCGSSYAPLSVDANPADFDFLDGKEYEIRRDMANLLDYTRDVPQGCNVAILVGHGNLRKSVMGLANRAPTADEMELMKSRLRKAMEHGAGGMSFGLYYAPGSYASTEEAVELSKIVAEYGGVIAAHIRDEEDELIKAVAEFIEIAERSGARAVISHHKASGRPENWGKVTHTLRMIDEANGRGCDIYCDVYPYTASSTPLSSKFFPKEEHAKGTDKIVELLDTKEYRDMLKKYIISRYGEGLSWVKTTANNPYPDCVGMTVPEIAKKRGTDEYDALFDIIRDSRKDAYACYFTMCEEDVETVLAHPRAMIATDSGNAAAATAYHPRLRGTFPRVLGRYVRERKVTSLPEMIRKMTAMPARVYGLKNKGLIWENMDADICIFDEKTIKDKADYDNIKLRAEGLCYVIVNGKITVKNAVSNGERNGKVVIF